ncbi:MAG: DedA family protein [Chloroflexales bacterium]
MNLSDLSSSLLTMIVTYGAFALGAVVFLAAVGLPFPSTFFVLASGAFIQQGVLDLYSTVAVALICVVLGDTTSYGMGRLLRRIVIARVGETAPWRSAEAYFQRRGAISIFLTRFLLTPIAVPINLIAGSSEYAALRFVGFAAAGELIWLALFGSLGYVFGSQWEYVSDLVSNLSGVIVGLVLLGVGVFWLTRKRGS